MVSRRAPPGALDYALLLGLAILWGMAFPLSKVAVEGYPPITLTLSRQIVAVFCLLILFVALRRAWRRPTSHELLLIAVCSVFGSVLPFTLINWGVERVDSGLAAILMGFMPLLTIVLAHIFTHDEKLSLPKLVGVLMGLAGLCLLFWPALTIGLDTVWRQLALIGAAICYAVNALVLRGLTHWPPLVLLVYIGFGTLALLVPMSFLLESPLAIDPTMQQTIAMIALGIVAYTLGAFFMFAIIDRQGASFFGQINLLVPVAGVFLGALFLGERPGWNALAALVIIVSGVVVARLKFSGLAPLKRKES
ncbi:MAG: DMT family transporter [Pseudomonadota bacterium]